MKSLLILLVLGLCHTVVPTPIRTSNINYALPRHVIPKNYQLKLSPQLRDDFNFKGTVIIRLNVLELSKNITLNAKNLELSPESCVLQNDNQVLNPSSFDLLFEPELLVIGFEQEIFGEYELSLSFEGNLKSKDCAFCAASYNNGEEQVWFAASQNGKIGTRSIFPCFDEPQFKATFDVSITHEKRYNAISNTPLLASRAAGEQIESVFETSPLLSTFSFAVVVSNFISRPTADKRVTIWTAPNTQENIVDYELLQQGLIGLEKYFGMLMPSKKLDIVIVSNNEIDSSVCWGTTILRKRSFVNPETYMQDITLQVAGDIVEQLVGQWFGSLVSPALWTDKWIIDGIKLYLRAYITDKIMPKQRILEDFIREYTQIYAFSMDRNDYVTHPLKRTLNSPKEINKKSAITDTKGSALIRMMQHMLTDKVFQQGLQQFLHKYSYKTASTDEFFGTLNDVARGYNLDLVNVKTIMNTWIEQKGYPVVTVTRDYKSGSALLTQERLGEPTRKDFEDHHNYKWWIPINYVNSGDSNIKDTSAQLLMKPNEDQSIQNLDSSRALILNKHQTGFYRVNYDVENWKMIANYLNSDEGMVQIPAANRAQFLYDVMTFVEMGVLNQSVLFEMMAYLHRENDISVWNAALHNLNYLLVNAKSNKYANKIKAYLWNQMKHLGDVRPLIMEPFYLKYACLVNDPICINKGRMELDAWINNLKDSKSVSSELLCAGMKDASRTLWDKVYEKYLSSPDIEQSNILQILTCSSDLLDHLFALSSQASSKITPTALLENILGSSVDVDRILSFISLLSNNMFTKEAIMENFFSWHTILKTLGNNITTQEQLQKMIDVVSSRNLLHIAERGINIARNFLDPQNNWFTSETSELYFDNFFKTH